jgi:hypothetical protein
MEPEAAARAAGILRTADELAAGVTPATLRWRLESGERTPIFRGWHAPTDAALPVEALRRRAALAKAGPDAWLTGVSALAEHGIRIGNDGNAHVAVLDRPPPRRQPGLVPHRLRRPPTLLAMRNGVPVESLEDAAVTAFGGLCLRDRRELLCRLVRQRRTTVVRLRAVATARGAFAGKPAFMETLGYIEIGCMSPIEIDYLLDVERPFGLPVADRQHRFRRARARSAYGDAYYKRELFLLELDGTDDHSDDDARRADLARDLDLAGQCVLTGRVTGRQIRGNPEQVACSVDAVLTARRLTIPEGFSLPA